MYCLCRCRNCTYQCRAANYSVSWGAVQARNGNLRSFGPTNLPGTAFTPKQWLFENKATCMENSKIYCSSPWKNPTYLCGSAKYPVSWVAGQSREWKYAKFRAQQSPWYHTCTKAMVISKGSYRYGKLKNVLLLAVRSFAYFNSRPYTDPHEMGQFADPPLQVRFLHQSPWYHVCTKAMVISKESYGFGKLINVLPLSVQKQYLPVRSANYTVSWGGSIRSGI